MGLEPIVSCSVGRRLIQFGQTGLQPCTFISNSVYYLYRGTSQDMVLSCDCFIHLHFSGFVKVSLS